MKAAFADAYDYFDTANAPIHTLSDWTRSETIPAGLMSVRHTSPFFWHPNSGYVLIIDAPEADKVLLERLRDENIPGAERFIYFASEAEARAYLLEILAAEEQKALS
jgi:hypothetical protein